MLVSQCCGAPIIFSDICSECKEHTGFIYLCENCGEEVDEGEDYCKECEFEMSENRNEVAHNTGK